MKHKHGKSACAAFGCLAAFLLWTVAVKMVDVQPVGPMRSSVGFATINLWVHNLTGVHMPLYELTDWLSLIPLTIAAGFALLGLVQWIRRKKLSEVDGSILVLGGFYLVVMGLYVFFEKVVINYRPVLIRGILEASYPSSTTMLVMCIQPTARMQFRQRIQNRKIMDCVSFSIHAFTFLMVMGRLLSGVHWFTDIVGGVLMSVGLVELYRAVNSKLEKT